MAIQITFNTEELTDEDVAVLGALARSLGDPEWARTAEKPVKRRPGRPRKTDEERAAEAEERAAEHRADNDFKERLATERVSGEVKDTTEEDEAPAEEPKPKQAKPAPAKAEKAPEKPAEEPKPEPEPEPEPEDDAPAGEDERDEAVKLATALVHDGRGAEVRSALKEVGAKKVSDLAGKSLTGFLAIVREL